MIIKRAPNCNISVLIGERLSLYWHAQVIIHISVLHEYLNILNEVIILKKIFSATLNRIIYFKTRKSKKQKHRIKYCWLRLFERKVFWENEPNINFSLFLRCIITLQLCYALPVLVCKQYQTTLMPVSWTTYLNLGT